MPPLLLRYLPFANLSKSSALYSTGKEVHISADKTKSFGLLRNRKKYDRLPHLPLLVYHHLVHEGNRAANPNEPHHELQQHKRCNRKGTGS